MSKGTKIAIAVLIFLFVAGVVMSWDDACSVKQNDNIAAICK